MFRSTDHRRSTYRLKHSRRDYNFAISKGANSRHLILAILRKIIMDLRYLHTKQGESKNIFPQNRRNYVSRKP